MDAENLTSPEARAKRIRRLRTSLRLSRNRFCAKYKKYGIAMGTLQGWEDKRWGGLTERGAKKLLKAFGDEGLNITLEWLFFGIGRDPLDGWVIPGRVKEEAMASEQSLITDELHLFKRHYPGAVHAIVADDKLAPLLEVGDYVGGQRYFDHDMQKYLGALCIVQTESGQQWIRFLHEGLHSQSYTLSPSAKCDIREVHLENIKLFSVAPIIWIRKVVKARKTVRVSSVKESAVSSRDGVARY